MRDKEALEGTKILVDKKTAAHLLSVSLRTIDNLVASKALPVRHIGRRALIPRAALENFARRDHATRPAGAGKADGDAC